MKNLLVSFRGNEIGTNDDEVYQVYDDNTFTTTGGGSWSKWFIIDNILYVQHPGYNLVPICNIGQRTLFMKKIQEAQSKLKGGKVSNMLREVSSDVKGFVKEHRSVIYTLAAVMLVDHFVFNGAFRDRLKALVEKFLHKAESKLDEVK